MHSHVNVAADTVVLVPDALSSAVAASLVLNGLTAFQMLTRCVSLGSTQNILVWSAAGGVGSVLLDLARHFGITAYGVASPSRLDFVAGKGAIPINRMDGDVSGALKRLAPHGVDAVFDGVGGPNITISQNCLNEGGTVVMFGGQGGLVEGRRSIVRLIRSYLSAPRINAFKVLQSNRGLKGYLITPWMQNFPDRYRMDLSQLFELAASGAISLISTRFCPCPRLPRLIEESMPDPNLERLFLILPDRAY